MPLDDARTANLLGALALAVTDEVELAVTHAAALPARGAATLGLLRQYPGQTVVALGRQLGLTHSGAVRVVDRLAAAGLMARGPGPDGRSLALGLTARGEQVADRLLGARAGLCERLVGGLPLADRRALELVCERLLTELTTSEERGDAICRLCDVSRCPLDACPVERAA